MFLAKEVYRRKLYWHSVRGLTSRKSSSLSSSICTVTSLCWPSLSHGLKKAPEVWGVIAFLHEELRVLWVTCWIPFPLTLSLLKLPFFFFNEKVGSTRMSPFVFLEDNAKSALLEGNSLRKNSTKKGLEDIQPEEIYASWLAWRIWKGSYFPQLITAGDDSISELWIRSRIKHQRCL